MTSKTEETRRLAYEIWMAEGCPHGRDEAHWREAEKRLATHARASGPARGPAKPADEPTKKAKPKTAKPKAGGKA